MKDGKAPLKAKPTGSDISMGSTLADMYMNPLKIDEELKSELRNKGLEYRFINMKTYKDMGFHRSHWKPYKRETAGPKDSGFGSDPEGYLRRGDLVLAVKAKEHAELHRNQLRLRAKLQSNPNKVRAAELKQMMQAAGIKGKVHEGFEDEGEEESGED